MENEIIPADPVETNETPASTPIVAEPKVPAVEKKAIEKKPAAEKKAPGNSVTFKGTAKKVVEGNPVVEIDGKEYEIRVPRFKAPGYGECTALEAATNEKLLRHLLNIGSSVLKEVF